jgi:hypothetical protein
VQLNLRAPVIVSILAATAVPVELRPPGSLGFSIQLFDVLANIAGYVPIGIVLAALSPVRAMLAATAITVTAESSQFFMMHRDPSVVDVAMNITGAAIGLALAKGLSLTSSRVTVTRGRAVLAALAAVVLIGGVSRTSGTLFSTRGATTPGVLEGHWTFDEPAGDAVLDASGHDLRGTLRNQPARVPGMRGGALAFDGSRAYVDFDRPPALRLIGDLTVSAWIKAASNPVDDAAIVSTIRHVGGNPNDLGFGLGFQLDTTVDTGPRTLGFKITNPCGSLVARYGATALSLDTWYHVAGVYDGKARALHVYVNGKLDDGTLRGLVQSARRASREPLYVGKRTDLGAFEFSGVIDDVRIYSRALTQDEVGADMQNAGTDASRSNGSGPRDGAAGLQPGPDADCSWSSEREDSRIPGTVAVVGVLVAIACVGLWPAWGAALGVALAAIAGLTLFRVATPTLPAMNLWMFPLTAVVGAVSVAAAVRRTMKS